MKLFTILVATLAAAYLAYVGIERALLQKWRKQIKIVVHVNGTRGKSTVTRLIDAGLRGCGLKVVGKTTGTVPTVLDVNNVAKPIERLAPANIREQLRTLRFAAREGAEALVIECMAVNPELQYLCEHRILHSDVGVITNVRADHLDEMGDDLPAIAYSLANTVPKNGVVVLGENKFVPIFEDCAQKLGSRVAVAAPYDGDPLDTFAENIAVALQVCDELHLNRNDFLAGMKNYHHDPGALAVFTKENTVFINGFSINDPESTLAVYEDLQKTYPAEEITILLNSRSDRPFRIDQHVEMVAKMPCAKVLLTGNNLRYVQRQLQKRGVSACPLQRYDRLLQEKYVFGCGNIANDGMRLIEYFQPNGEQK